MVLIHRGLPRETVKFLAEEKLSKKWPFTVGPIVCPDCFSIFRISPHDDKDYHRFTREDNSGITNQTKIACPNCQRPPFANIWLKRKKKPLWKRMWCRGERKYEE